MAWNDNLSGDALAIATANDRRIRVMAGPGSGKTFALMRRIARLLEQGTQPSKILLLSFTRTAATDLVKSLNELNVSGSDQIKAGTLHSFCFSVLNQERVLLLTNRVARPLLNFEKDFLLEDISQLRQKGKREMEKQLNAFEAAWARLQYEEAGFASNPADVQFQGDVLGYLGFVKGMLIGELIPVTLEYLRTNPQCPELSSYDYVFVDEYQDLNKAEQSLINLLSDQGKLMVIGDEDQSIYQGFRHANPEGIRLFHETHRDTVDYSLSVCRRCPKKIVRVADKFIQLNENRQVRHLNPKTDNQEGSIIAIQWNSIRDEAEGIATYIRGKIREGTNAGEILVLCPRRQFGNAVKDALVENGIEAHSYFQEEILESLEAKEAYSILNLLTNPKDIVSWRYLIGKGDNPNNAGFKRIREYCVSNHEEFLGALEKLENSQITIPYTSKIVENYRASILKISALKEMQGMNLVNSLFPSYEQWAKPFRDLLINIDEDSDFSDILEIIRTNVIQPEMPNEVDLFGS